MRWGRILGWSLLALVGSAVLWWLFSLGGRGDDDDLYRATLARLARDGHPTSLDAFLARAKEAELSTGALKVKK